MYERFTDRARKVVALANQEGQRFNHDYLGTEHLLIALAKEKRGVGATILNSYKLDFNTLRREVEKLVKSGPDIVSIGKLPQTPQVKEVFESAIQYAKSLNHNYVGTEHILGGVAEQKEGAVAEIFKNYNLDEKKIKEDLEIFLGVR